MPEFDAPDCSLARLVIERGLALVYPWAFGSVSRERIELVIEGTAAAAPGPHAEWREYGFWGKPDDPGLLPPQVAPDYLRLDWPLWFIPLSPPYGGGWFVRYRFATWDERRGSGQWWLREVEGDHLPPVRLDDLRREPAT